MGLFLPHTHLRPEGSWDRRVSPSNRCPRRPAA